LDSLNDDDDDNDFDFTIYSSEYSIDSLTDALLESGVFNIENYTEKTELFKFITRLPAVIGEDI
jgi:hypothetical protein